MPKQNPQTIRRSKVRRRSSQTATFLKNTFLPQQLELRVIKDLLLGERAYADPDSMLVDETGRCWLISTDPIEERDDFEEHIAIWRGEDGFFVDVCDIASYWRWQRTEADSSFYQQDKETYSPVLRITGFPKVEETKAS